MHSISTRATTHGRRRTLKRLGVVGAGAIAASGLITGVAFAQPDSPAIAIVQTTPSPDLNTPAGLLTFKITITSTDAGAPEELADLYLGTCSSSTGQTPANPPATAVGVCPPADSVPALDIRSIQVDPHSPANCGPASFVPVNPQPPGSSANYTVSGMFLQQSGDCMIDVTVAPGGMPSNSPVYFLATADTLVNGVSGTPSTPPAPVASQVNLIPGPVTPPVHRDDKDSDHRDKDSDHKDHDSDHRDNRRHEAPLCGNSGNGNVGCNNSGNGNVGDNNTGNGNVDDEHGSTDHGDDHGNDI